MKRRKIFLAGFFILALIFGFHGCGTEEDGEEVLDWLFMVYMGGDNNLSNMALDDINEMEMVGSKNNVAIVVQAEFSRDYSPGLSTYNTLRFYIEKDNDPRIISSTYTDIGNKNMADPATLTDFIKWATSQYKAKKYALTIWDHGAGWKDRPSTCVRGAVEDDTSNDFMSLPELAKGIKNSGVHLHLIDFDACLMGMYEVAYQFKGLCDVMVFSEESEPGDGNPYNTILVSLTANPSMSASDLGKLIVQKYFEFYNNQRASITKSAVDLSKIETLHQKIINLGNVLSSKLSTSRPFIEGSQQYCQNYAYPFCRDIGHLCYLLSRGTDATITSAAQDLRNFITSGGIVLANATYSGESSSSGDEGDVSNSTGISIYFPRKNEARSSDLAEYQTLAVSQGTNTWNNFLINFLEGSSQPTAPGFFMFILTWDTDSDVDLYVIEPDGTVASPWMGSTSPNGFLSGDSAETGISREVYNSADWVMPGDYTVIANYYEDWSYNYANVYLEFVDFYYNIDETYGPRRMSLDNPLPPEAPIDNNHSDWWIIGTLHREAGKSARFVPTIPEKYTDGIPLNRDKLNKKRKISPDDISEKGESF